MKIISQNTLFKLQLTKKILYLFLQFQLLEKSNLSTFMQQVTLKFSLPCIITAFLIYHASLLCLF